MNCIRCKNPLAGGIDTYGEVGEEMCQSCWLEWCEGWMNEYFGQERQPATWQQLSFIRHKTLWERLRGK